MKYLLILVIALAGCARSHADSGFSVQSVAAPQSGYACFVIVNGSGQGVGGNCVKTE